MPGYYTEQRSSQHVCCAVQQYDIQKSQNPICTYTVFVKNTAQTVTCLYKQEQAFLTYVVTSKKDSCILL
jgi:hypothetical protein